MFYLTTIFISAFLLFQIQPIIGKIILPLFGGGVSIWTSCLLFFQCFLLFGYYYAHRLSVQFTLNKQIKIHCTLLVISLIFLLLFPIQVSSSSVNGEPLWDIIKVLVITIGLPYFILSSTSPLVQRWFSYAETGRQPYRLYSLSNIGSLLALLSYPFIIEPKLPLMKQSSYWSFGYFIFVLSSIFLMVYLSKKLNIISQNTAQNELINDNEENKDKSNNSLLISFMWVFLSALGVVLLISTTNTMTQEITPIPFLWILPLCLYLLTFIICFHHSRWYVRWCWFGLFILSAYAAMVAYFMGNGLDIISVTIIYSFALFSACMVCHGELVNIKPKNNNQLTRYYLYIAAGGFLGSVFVSFGAQNLFDHYIEFPLSILAVLAVFMLRLILNSRFEKNDDNLQVSQNRLGVLFGKHKRLKLATGFAFVILSYMFIFNFQSKFSNKIAASRNFYGVLYVNDVVNVGGREERRLMHGNTLHGLQPAYPLNLMPTLYYQNNTGVSYAIRYAQKHSITPIKVGVIGLGVGTLAAYGRKGDRFDFYEINPDVEVFANQYFSYLENSSADIEVILGDARITLEEQLLRSKTGADHLYDVMVVDAFSSDAIPSHLLTKEAGELYFKHLSPNGLVAFHISNKQIDLFPIMKGLANNLNASTYYFNTIASVFTENNTPSKWVILTRNADFASSKFVQEFQSNWPEESDYALLWTDDYNDLLSVIR